VAGRFFATGERVPGTAGENSAAVLPVHAQQPERVPVPGPQAAPDGDRVQPDTVHGHVLHHARVPGGRRPAVAPGDRPANIATVRRERRNHRLGTGLWVTVHAGRGQHTDGGQSDGAPDKRDTSKCDERVTARCPGRPISLFRSFCFPVLNIYFFFKFSP